jgi:hypothetical protein
MWKELAEKRERASTDLDASKPNRANADCFFQRSELVKPAPVGGREPN